MGLQNNNIRPPKLAERIFKRLFPDHGKHTLNGDLEEEYNLIYSEKGLFKAKLWYYCQVLRGLTSKSLNTVKWSAVMYKNYLKIALRNIKKHKGYSFINIAGLAVGMACCILILLWVQHEISYDRFQENADYICRVLKGSEGDPLDKYYAITPPPLAEALKDFPEIINSARITDYSSTLLQYKDKEFNEAGVLFASPSIFKIFTLPLVKGDPEIVLRDLHSIVITEKMAEKYFGEENPVGKVLKIENKCDVTVTGVLKNVPKNSHLKIDFIVPFTLLKEINVYFNYNQNNWGFNNYYTYILLSKNINYKEVERKIFDYYPKNVDKISITRLKLQPLKNIHLYSNFQYDRMSDTKQIRYVYIFTVIAVFVLLIACINFINMTTAFSGTRAREIGMRKVIGANRKNILYQFFGETVLLSMISLIFSFIFVVLLIPTFNQISGKELSINFMENRQFILILAGVTIFAGLISGSYPAVFLSSFQPVKVLKGALLSGKNRSFLRKILVVTQFSLSIILIISTLILKSQLEFINKKDLGFEKENILYFNTKTNLGEKGQALKTEMLRDPNVLEITATNLHSNQRPAAYLDTWEGKSDDKRITIYYYHVDYDLLKTYNMQLADGRFFSEKLSSDDYKNIVVNETAVREMGMDNPLGKTVSLGGREFKVIGIVKNFNFKSLKNFVEPVLFYLSPNDYGYFFVKINPDNFDRTIAYLKLIWKKFYPNNPFEYGFLQERFNSMYRSEYRMNTLFNYFTGMSIFIACLGLFGLASYKTQQRKKEIGIRKVLGASFAGISGLLVKEFVVLIGASSIIAWPVSYFFADKWLQDFAYKTGLNAFVFIFSGILALIIAVLTVSYQTIKAAAENPVEGLRQE